jgi:Ni/Fe-hydrogenase subunit HybB-like protein
VAAVVEILEEVGQGVQPGLVAVVLVVMVVVLQELPIQVVEAEEDNNQVVTEGMVALVSL